MLVRRFAVLGLFIMLAAVAIVSTASAQLDGRTNETGGDRDVSGQTVRTHLYGTPGNCLRVVTAGVQTRNADPAPPTAGGSIVLPAGPEAGNVVWAGLYWEILGSTAPVNAVTLNGSAVTPVALPVTASPCWPEANAYPFFADVTGLVVAGVNVVAGLDDSGTLAVGPESEGASLVVVYQGDQTSGSACEIIVTDGNDLTRLSGQSYENLLPVSCGDDVAATLTFLGADGQTGIHGFAPDDQLWNHVVLSGSQDDWNASDPDAPGAEAELGWDTDSWAVTTGGSNVAAIDIPLLGGPGDCVNWIATVLEVGVGECLPTPTRSSTWGEIKAIYR
ncbi:MAG: hypothetical protein QUU85_14725 [Candidatus Eisenbacteria bacterium]|nr:hypothetical protein [Candidatus Eisenbacteria bacterium]